MANLLIQAAATAALGVAYRALTPDTVIKNEEARLDEAKISAASEGSAIPKVWGRQRVPGQVIWATKFREVAETDTETQSSGKGTGPSVVTETTTYRYYQSFAIGLCESNGAQVSFGRIWADGVELDQSQHTIRFYDGSETQTADSAIVLTEGSAPAFRGLAYLVFDDFEVSTVGNRIPQITVEVSRSLNTDPDRVEEKLEAVTLAPGTGEFSYGTRNYYTGGGETSTTENVSQLQDTPDFVVSLDRLEDDVSNVSSVELAVAWFGSDLRCETCEIKPKVDSTSKTVQPVDWQVSTETRESASIVSEYETGKVFSKGTPADVTVREALSEIKTRGHRAVFYPSIVMDIEDGNTLPTPYSDNAATSGQPVYPWRGRVTCSPAAGYVGTVDQTATAGTQVASFVGTVLSSDFGTWDGTQLPYTGAAEWSFRRMILHYAHLCKDILESGDAFIIGSELVGMTTVRDAGSNYPFVDALVTLLGEVKAVLPAGVEVSYAADWTEYHSHRPDDGSSDVYFNMDPLWDAADFVGINNFLPITDWRTADEYDYRLTALMGGIEGGEYYDYFYASAEDRDSNTRTSIEDQQFGEAWSFRQKDLRNWWGTTHHDRPAGAQEQLYADGNLPDTWSGGAVVSSDGSTFGTYANAAAIASSGADSDYAQGSNISDGIISGETYEFGAVIKPGTSNQIRMYLGVTGITAPQFQVTDIAALEVGFTSATLDSASIEQLDGGFYRVTGTFTSTVTDASVAVRVGPNSAAAGEDVIVVGAFVRCTSTATSASTDWEPGSKEIWFTGFGTAAIDKGTNQPAAYLDSRSSESAMPYFSTGARDDLIQRRYIEAMLKYWEENSPAGMVSPSNMFARSWDARPYPNYPYGDWPDRDNWRQGHQLSGRLNVTFLKDVFLDLGESVGLQEADFDFSGLENFPALVRGYVSTSLKSPREILEELAMLSHSDTLESEGVIKVLRKRQADSTTLDVDNLIPSKENPGGFELVTAQETEIPREITLTFANESNAFQAASASGKRSTGNSQLVREVRSSSVIEPEEARNLCEELLSEAVIGRETFSGSFPRDILVNDPGDIFSITLSDQAVDYRIVEYSIGASVQVEAVRCDKTIYTPRSVVAALPNTSSGISAPGSALVEFIDIPLLTDASLRPWAPRIVGYQNPWPGGIILYQDDGSGGYTSINELSTPATVGETTAEFPAGKIGMWDNESTLAVYFYGEKSNIISLSETSVLNGANTVAVRTPAGWELVQYRNATIQGDGSYHLTGLLRGQNGTEYAMATSLAAGARVVFIDSAWGSLNMTQDQIGLEKDFRYGPAGVAVGDARYQDETYTPSGRSLMPFAPVHLKRKDTGSGHLLQWIRRTRINGDSWEGTVPLNEESEQYEVDIYNGSTVVRTIEVADATSTSYTSSDQITDFGAEQDTLKFTVYQISTAVGRGEGATYDDT